MQAKGAQLLKPKGRLPPKPSAHVVTTTTLMPRAALSLPKPKDPASLQTRSSAGKAVEGGAGAAGERREAAQSSPTHTSHSASQGGNRDQIAHSSDEEEDECQAEGSEGGGEEDAAEKKDDEEKRGGTDIGKAQGSEAGHAAKKQPDRREKESDTKAGQDGRPPSASRVVLSSSPPANSPASSSPELAFAKTVTAVKRAGAEHEQDMPGQAAKKGRSAPSPSPPSVTRASPPQPSSLQVPPQQSPPAAHAVQVVTTTTRQAPPPQHQAHPPQHQLSLAQFSQAARSTEEILGVYKHLVTQETDRVGAITAAYQGALIMRAQITAAEAEKEELQKELQALKRALNENSQRWTKRAGELEAEVARLTRMLQAQTPRSTESEGSAALLRESVRTMERSLAQERMKANFLQAAFAAEQQKANELGMKLALCEAAPSLHRPPSQP